MFQHTAARRRLLYKSLKDDKAILFQHTAARRRLAAVPIIAAFPRVFQHTAARRRLKKTDWRVIGVSGVSTHSRPKAAGNVVELKAEPWAFQHTAARRRLIFDLTAVRPTLSFNTQPPEGGCSVVCTYKQKPKVSTHSRPKAAVGDDGF